MRKEKPITLPKETEDQILTEIQNYFSKERGEDIGDLAAMHLLDFLLEKIAPAFYNQGVQDSYRYMQESTEDLLSIKK